MVPADGRRRGLREEEKGESTKEGMRRKSEGEEMRRSRRRRRRRRRANGFAKGEEKEAK